jgi:undecaprenyl-diphosphatase
MLTDDNKPGMAHRAAHPENKTRRMQWLYLAVCLVGLYAIVPQIGSFHKSLTLLAHVHSAYLLAVCVFSGLTYCAASATYCLLSHRHLPYMKTVIVEFASMFVNRLLPGGIGGIGTNYRYLRTARHSKSQAAAIVAVNNALGFMGNGLLLLGVIVFMPSTLGALHVPVVSRKIQITFLAVVVAAAIVSIAYPQWRRRGLRAMRSFVHQLRQYRRHSWRLYAALTSSVGLTIANVLAFGASVDAIGIHLSFVSILLVFSFGVLLGTVTPTPGGLGGVEAGLVAGLIAYHLSAAEALAAVLIYRLISYWLALLVGGLAFVVSDHRHYFG